MLFDSVSEGAGQKLGEYPLMDVVMNWVLNLL